MFVFRINKTKNYTVMSNYHLQDKNLSYKAKGLLSYMLSLPEDWDYSLAGLAAISKESKDGIRSILNELKEHHYLEIEKIRGEKGHFEYNYLIYEIPQYLELKNDKIYPGMEKPTQINTNKQIDKDDKTKMRLLKKYTKISVNYINSLFVLV